MSQHFKMKHVFALVASLLMLSACATNRTQPQVAPGVDPELGTLVTTEWLSQHLDDPDLVVLDCTVVVERAPDGGIQTVSGRNAFEEGHIPTAGFADLTAELADTDSPLGFAVPTPEQFARAMGALGVGDNSRVVLYSNGYSAWAARVWWMLKWIGFDRAALLDGGLPAWTAEGRPVSKAPSPHPVRQLTAKPRPELIVGRDEVLAAINDEKVSLVDALPAAHFSGDMSLYGRPGHIPGASNLPASSLYDETGRFLPSEELARLVEGDRNTRTIQYCGGGISAASNAFVLSRLGFTNVAVYTASLQEWAADSENPLTTDTP